LLLEITVISDALLLEITVISDALLLEITVISDALLLEITVKIKLNILTIYFDPDMFRPNGAIIRGIYGILVLTKRAVLKVCNNIVIKYG
jgi:hypothetical protein